MESTAQTWWSIGRTIHGDGLEHPNFSLFTGMFKAFPTLKAREAILPEERTPWKPAPTSPINQLFHTHPPSTSIHPKTVFSRPFTGPVSRTGGDKKANRLLPARDGLCPRSMRVAFGGSAGLRREREREREGMGVRSFGG